MTPIPVLISSQNGTVIVVVSEIMVYSIAILQNINVIGETKAL